MLYNYFKLACRNLWNNKVYTAINSLGLATGLSIFTLVLIYINYERSYDQWDNKLQQVYRVGISEKRQGNVNNSPSVQYPLGTHLAAECPEISLLTRVRPGGEMLIGYKENNFFDKLIIAADSNFFNVFPYKFLSGNAQSALSQSHSAVIARSVSERLFGKEDPIGKLIKLENNDTYTVTGVIDKVTPSHLNFDICLSNNSNYFASNWFMENQDTYVVLKPGSPVAQLQKKAQSIYLTYNKLIPKDANPVVFFEQVSNIHLSSQAQNTWGAGNVTVYDFGADNIPLAALLLIGTAILLLSCINYTNMAIARAGKRAKESGLRKVLGASKKQLIVQFLVEAFIQSVIATALAVYFTLMLKNTVNNSFNLNLHIWSEVNGRQNSQFVLQLIVIILAVTIISGFYPAFVLSRFKPAKVLKGDAMKNIGGHKLRNVLIVFQYTVATCFIISILIIGLQMHFLHSKDPGFNTDQTLRIQVRNGSPKLFPGQSDDKSVSVTNALMKIPGITAVSMSDSYPGQPYANIQQAIIGSKNDTMSMRFNYINFGYFKLLGMQLKEGRDFSPVYATDSVNTAVINETAVRQMGLKKWQGKEINIVSRKYTVIGVVKDTYLSGYGDKIPPEIYAVGVPPGNFSGHSNLLIKIDGNKASDVLKQVTAFWKTVDAGYPMRYAWLDQDFEKLMEKDERFTKIAEFLTLAAVILAGMGILSLSAFTAEQRTKEIGIRKVLGASVNGIVGSFFLEFIKLVFISIIIAAPIAWLIMQKWLQGFAYHITITWWMFFISGITAILIAILTVSFQALKVALANPINSLKVE